MDFQQSAYHTKRDLERLMPINSLIRHFPPAPRSPPKYAAIIIIITYNNRADPLTRVLKKIALNSI